LTQQTKPAKRSVDIAGRLAIGALITFLGLVLFVSTAKPWLHGDSGGVVKGSEGIIHCIEHGRFSDCDRLPDGHQSGQVPGKGYVPGAVSDFPLLQYIPSTAFRWIFSFMTTARLLVALNALALSSTVALSWYTTRRIVGGPWPPLLALTLIASPLLWYAIAAYGEDLAAFTLVAAVAAVALRAQPWLVITAIAIACTSKETHAPFLLVACGLVALSLAPTPADTRRMMIPVVAGCGAGIALNAAFNIFRFGSLFNTAYLQPYYRVPTYSLSARYFAAMWVSPNGGIIWWWPAALGMLLLLAIGASSRRARAGFGARGVLAGWGILALLVVNFAGLSRWWAPFGWVTWAPRLLLPLIPALLLAAVVSCGQRAMHTIQVALSRAWFWLFAAFVAVLALPQLGVLFSTSPFGDMFKSDSICVKPRDVLEHPDEHYRCMMHEAWTKKPILLHGLSEVFTPWGLFAAALFAAAFVALLWCAKTRASDATPEERGELGSVGRAGRSLLLDAEGSDGVVAPERGLQEEARAFE
jgi:hypothetical protein